MAISRVLSFYQEAFIRLFFPAYCGACSDLLRLPEQVLCLKCAQILENNLHTPEEAPLLEKFESLDETWTLYEYQAPVNTLLRKVKFERGKWVLNAFNSHIQHMIDLITSENHYDLIIPIPIHRIKFLEREFNQAELIANTISKQINIPIEKNILKKALFSTSSQSLLSRTERLANAYGSFYLKNKKKIVGKKILIIDDILTTGATAEEAARILKAQGAKRVDVFTLAHTPEQKEKKAA